MTEVLHFPSPPSASSPSSSSPSSNVTLLISSDHRRRNLVPEFAQDVDFQSSIEEEQHLQDLRRNTDGEEEDNEENGGDYQLSLLDLLIDLFRRSLISCKSNRRELCNMEIGWSTSVRSPSIASMASWVCPLNSSLRFPEELQAPGLSLPPSNLTGASKRIRGRDMAKYEEESVAEAS